MKTISKSTKTTVVDKLTPEGKRLEQEIAQLKKLRVKVGFQRGEAVEEKDGTVADLCDIALWNELGTETAPSRPFMRDAIDKHKDEVLSFIEKEFALLVVGQNTAEKMMKSIGVFLVKQVQREIVDGQFEPNAPSTIKRKGSDKPLIDTGTMRQSVNYVISNDGKYGDVNYLKEEEGS